jgi:hypothetical protein
MAAGRSVGGRWRLPRSTANFGQNRKMARPAAGRRIHRIVGFATSCKIKNINQFNRLSVAPILLKLRQTTGDPHESQ